MCSRKKETMCIRKFLSISYLEHKTNDRAWSKIDFLLGPEEPLLANVKRQKLAWFGMSLVTTTSPGHLGGWATPWSAEDMMDGQHQRVDISAHARTTHKGLLQKRLEGDLC